MLGLGLLFFVNSNTERALVSGVLDRAANGESVHPEKLEAAQRIYSNASLLMNYSWPLLLLGGPLTALGLLSMRVGSEELIKVAVGAFLVFVLGSYSFTEAVVMVIFLTLFISFLYGAWSKSVMLSFLVGFLSLTMVFQRPYFIPMTYLYRILFDYTFSLDYLLFMTTIAFVSGVTASVAAILASRNMLSMPSTLRRLVRR